MSKGSAKRRRLLAIEAERQYQRSLNPIKFDLIEDLRDAYAWECMKEYERAFKLLMSVAITVSELHDKEVQNDATTRQIPGECLSSPS